MAKKRIKKVLGMLLSMAMLLSVPPLSAMAAQDISCTEHVWDKAGLCTVCGAEKPAGETGSTIAPVVPSNVENIIENDAEEENGRDSSAAPQHDNKETAPGGVSPEEACPSGGKAPVPDQTIADEAEDNEHAEESEIPTISAENKQIDADSDISEGTAPAGSDASSPVEEIDQTGELPAPSAVEVEDAEEEPAVPFCAYATVAGVSVYASAPAGVLPAGTTMRLRSVTAAAATAAVSPVVDEDICSVRGVDISFYNADEWEIEPNGDVQISMRLTNPLEGEEFAVIHVADNGTAESLGGATANGAIFASDEFSLYVLVGVGTQEDPITNAYREYTIGFGETVTILSDEKDHNGAWIPAAGNPAWSVTAVSGGNVDQLATLQSVRGAADVQPRLTVTAKNQPGTLRVAFRYTHPEDQTHKTVTGEFIATHYYLVHIVDQSTNTYSVVFKNNDGTGVSRVGEDDLKFTTEEGVTVTRTVSSSYTHTFTVSASPTTRAGKVTLIMPQYPGNTTRISGGTTFRFIGWSTLATANSSTAANQQTTPIVYPYTDAHIFAPGDRFPLDRNVTLWAIWAAQDSMTATFWIRIDDHIPNEPQSHGNASYIQIGKNIKYTLPSAQFATDAVYGIDQGWDASQRQKPWPARVFSDLQAAGKLPDDVNDVQEFNARYRIVWSTIKRENDGWHVDGILYERALYNLAYHENGDLVVVSSMPEGVKDIPKGDTTIVDTRIPNRYDMTFVGWNTQADGNGTAYIPGASVVVSEHPELDTSINTLHLYAQWVKSTQYTYHVRFLEAGTDKVLKDPVFYSGQILGNKIYSKAESEKASSEIANYLFSYADPAIGSGDGCISIGKDNSKNVITLYYMPKEQEILATALVLTKTDEAGNPKAGAEFTLTPQSGSATVLTSDENGIIQIPFTEDPGPNVDDVLSYTLVESKAPDGYVKTDDVFTILVKRGTPRVANFPDGTSKTVFPLTVTVQKNDIEISAANGVTVVNKAKPDPITYSIPAKKVLEGRALAQGEFTFVLTANGEQLATAVNKADGSISFDGLRAYEAGTYVYQVSETNGNDPEIVYDDSVYTVTVVVELDADNHLSVSSMTYKKNGGTAGAATFVNRFNPTLFTITYDLNGGMYNGDTAKITEQYPDGTEIVIHEAPTRDGYTFLYWKGSEYQPGDSYTVTEDHTFVAQWEENVVPTPAPTLSAQTTSPSTGDENHVTLWAALWIVSLLGMVFILFSDRKAKLKIGRIGR